MKILPRYLFFRLLAPFAFTLFACTLIWLMADLYGNVDDFLGHKTNFGLIVTFYALQIPIMLVQVLPAAILFSTLWTLLGLSRTNEWLALQAGGIAPLRLYMPFFLFAFIWVGVLAYDLSGPSASSQVRREKLLQQVKGQGNRQKALLNLSYVDKEGHRFWFFQRLDAFNGKAEGVNILQRDEDGHDVSQWFVRSAQWTGEGWKLSGVREFIYGPDGNPQTQTSYDQKMVPLKTTPYEISLIGSQPDQLTLPQLNQFIHANASTPDRIASFRTEWWYRVLHPFSLIILMLYALVYGVQSGRKGAVAGVGWTIFVLLLYVISMNIFMAAGRFNRVPPIMAVLGVQLIFGAIGLQLLAMHNRWFWFLFRPRRALPS